MTEALTIGPQLVLSVTLGDLHFAVKSPVADVALQPGISLKLLDMARALACWLEDRADPVPEGDDAVAEWVERRVALIREKTGIEPLSGLA